MKEDVRNFSKSELLPDDLSLVQQGTRGRWSDRNFEITGRVQYSFEDESYLNWWHLETAGNTLGWLAESYGDYFIMEDYKLPVPFARVEQLSPGEEVRIGDQYFQMISFDQVTGWILDGEFSLVPEIDKTIWIELENADGLCIDIQVFNRQHNRSFKGIATSAAQLGLTNLRILNGWSR